MEWAKDVLALEGAAFAGGCNLIVVGLFVLSSIQKTKLSSWGDVLRVSAFGLLTVMTLIACLGLLSFIGLGGVEAPGSDNGA